MGSKRNEVINEISDKARFYTPEWRFDAENPDAASALALIWAEMLSGTLTRIDGLADAAEVVFLNALGAENRPAVSARGYLSFTAKPDASGAVTIAAGTRVCAVDDPDAVLVTESELVLEPAVITAVYEGSPEPDCARRLDGLENLSLFGFPEANTRTWSFTHPYAFDISGGGVVRLKLDCGAGVKTRSAASALSKPENAVWERLTDDGFRPVLDVAAAGGDILLYHDGDEDEYDHDHRSFGSGVRVRIGDKRPFEGTLLRGVRVLPQNVRLKPDAVCSGDLERTDAGFFPFGETFMVYDTVGIACEEALSKPGAHVEMSFTLRTQRIPIEGAQIPEQEWKPVMRPWDIVGIEEREVSVTECAWEYFNGTGWSALAVYPDARDIFRPCGEEPERHTLSFVCPEDMAAVTVGAYDKRFIRARITAVENAFCMYGFYMSPWMEDISFSYAFRDGVTPETIVTQQNMERREILDLRRPVPLIDRRFTEPAVYFELDRPFGGGSLLWEAEDLSKERPVRFEYYAGTGWRNLTTGAVSLGKTELMTFTASKPPEKLRLFGRDSYWIRAVDLGDDDGEINPVIRRIRQNTVPAVAAVPGTGSNLEAGSVTVPLTPIKGAAGVTNPLPVTGGFGAETDADAIMRYRRARSHRDRAVSRRDIEDLAMEASPAVLRCRCLPNTDGTGARHPRDTCLVLFAPNVGGGGFGALAETVREYVGMRRPVSSGELHIISPRLVRVNVKLAAVTRSGAAGAVKSEALERLREFLDPVTGGFGGKGWEIGSVPALSQIVNALTTLEAIKRVEEFGVRYTVSGEADTADYARIREDALALPANGEHGISIKRDTYAVNSQ